MYSMALFYCLKSVSIPFQYQLFNYSYVYKRPEIYEILQDKGL